MELYIASFIFVAIGAGRAVLAVAGQQYHLMDLGTFPDGSTMIPTAINLSGEVVGYGSTPSAVHHAFLWSSGVGMQDLGVLPNFSGSEAYGVNDSGQVVGRLTVSGNGAERAFLWTKNSGMQDLGVFPGDDAGSSEASGINNSGEIVGTENGVVGSENYRAFIWTTAGGMQGLGSLPSGVIGTIGVGINSSGQVVGQEIVQGTLARRGFVWSAASGVQPIIPQTGATVDSAFAHASTTWGRSLGPALRVLPSTLIAGPAAAECKIWALWPATLISAMGILSIRSETLLARATTKIAFRISIAVSSGQAPLE